MLEAAWPAFALASIVLSFSVGFLLINGTDEGETTFNATPWHFIVYTSVVASVSWAFGAAQRWARASSRSECRFCEGAHAAPWSALGLIRGNVPIRMPHHDGDVGHSVVLGSTCAGKSPLESWLSKPANE